LNAVKTDPILEFEGEYRFASVGHVYSDNAELHLLEAMRNALLRSQAGGTRDFMIEGIKFGWPPVVEAYRRDEKGRPCADEFESLQEQNKVKGFDPLPEKTTKARFGTVFNNFKDSNTGRQGKHRTDGTFRGALKAKTDKKIPKFWARCRSQVTTTKTSNAI
jgi:hypothetical protein